MPTLSDAEIEFYRSVLDDPDGKSINDLRYAYFLAAINGDLPAPSLASVPGYNASVAQVLEHDDAGALVWTNKGI